MVLVMRPGFARRAERMFNVLFVLVNISSIYIVVASGLCMVGIRITPFDMPWIISIACIVCASCGLAAFCILDLMEDAPAAALSATATTLACDQGQGCGEATIV